MNDKEIRKLKDETKQTKKEKNLDLDDSDSEEEIELDEDFINWITKWVELDDKSRIIKKELRNFGKEKKEIETNILQYMEQLDDPVIAISDGKLKKNVSKTKGALKHETIQNALIALTKDTKQAYEITQFILSNRPVVERVNLKRTGLKREK